MRYIIESYRREENRVACVNAVDEGWVMGPELAETLINRQIILQSASFPMLDSPRWLEGGPNEREKVELLDMTP